MAQKRSAKKTPHAMGLVSRMSISRQTITTAFVQCMNDTATSQQRAARELELTKRTVGAWVRCESAISVERVLADPRLAKAFRRALCVHEHAEPVGYVVRKGRR
jgi:hypothetical protein